MDNLMRVSKQEYADLTSDEQWRYDQGWQDGYFSAVKALLGSGAVIALVIYLTERIAA